MKTFRAQFTHENLTWITHGYTREEAMFRMRDAVQRWVLTTGNPWPTGDVAVTDVTQELERQVAEYLDAVKPDKPSHAATAPI